MLIQIKKLYDKTFGYLFYSFYDRYDNYWTDGLAYVQATGYISIVKFLLIFIVFGCIGKPAFMFLKDIGKLPIIITAVILFYSTYALNKKNVQSTKNRVNTVFIVLLPLLLFLLGLSAGDIKDIITRLLE